MPDSESVSLQESKTTTDETTLREAGNRDETILRTAGQRRVNLIWEGTQALIALAVVGSVLYVTVRIILRAVEPNGTERVVAMGTTALVLLSNVLNLVCTSYFLRTNHVKTGGVTKEDHGR